jgi:hypothetical protein
MQEIFMTRLLKIGATWNQDARELKLFAAIHNANRRDAIDHKTQLVEAQLQRAGVWGVDDKPDVRREFARRVVAGLMS